MTTREIRPCGKILIMATHHYLLQWVRTRSLWLRLSHKQRRIYRMGLRAMPCLHRQRPPQQRPHTATSTRATHNRPPTTLEEHLTTTTATAHQTHGMVMTTPIRQATGITRPTLRCLLRLHTLWGVLKKQQTHEDASVWCELCLWMNDPRLANIVHTVTTLEYVLSLYYLDP